MGTKHRKLNVGEGFKQLIGAAQATIGVVKGAVGAVQQVLNLFGKQSSDSLVGQFTNQGFSKFDQATDISETTLPEAIFDVWAKDAMKDLYNVPKKHKKGINHMVKYAKYVDDNSWLALEGTFDIDSGGQSNQIQLFTSRDIECGRINVVFVYTSTKFKLKPDLFIISKSESRLGGAFSSTKLQWKSKNAALKTADLKFVSEYFLALGMAHIQNSRKIANYAGTRNCGGYRAPAEQINPFADFDDDDLGGQSFSVNGGISGSSGGNNYNVNFGYKNEWDTDDNLGNAGGVCSERSFQIALQKAGPQRGVTRRCQRAVFFKVCSKCGRHGECYYRLGRKVAPTLPECGNKMQNDNNDLGGQSFSVNGGISGFSQGQLNGPTNGGYNPGFRNYNAPIVRLANDEDDELGRWGGWNGAAAQAAAMAISGFSQGQLNGPTNGGYNPGFRNYNAPIVRLANDEDDELGR